MEERSLTESLAKHAADAPTDSGLLVIVHARLRRRSHRTIGALVAAAAVATVLIASQGLTSPPVSQGAASAWRWESFRTVQVQVPSSWTRYISGPAPCTTFANTAVPTIGRVNGWSASREYTCTTPVIPLAHRQPYLWFNDTQAPGIKQYDGGWTEETRVVGGVKLSVLTKDDTLRRRILDSAQPITGTDHYGCTPEEPAKTPTTTPTVQITSASVCEYWQGSLIAGSSVPDDKVLTLASQVFIPPGITVGPGFGCQDPSARTYVVILHGGDKTWMLTIPYSVCTHLLPRSLALLRLGPHQQFEPAATFDPAKPITPLAR
ncbi:hypothetical protein GCM10009630_48300 [Kribbella jejuensis]|uniref:Uncharacterized protein n=1 Tax=Kribbella jejuensis TaxID=236068 RepID=A0A542E7A9_9ACTN|nr:hypothetical protein [Kribbella jejuensis]TQJ11220.1 hypothetical protein FB475_4128 [Kribbella jejuensis]